MGIAVNPHAGSMGSILPERLFPLRSQIRAQHTTNIATADSASMVAPIAPIISAITGLDGIPCVCIGTNEVCAPALLAASA